MSNTAALDTALAQHTAIRSFAELLATPASYVPTLDIREAPSLIAVARALIAAGRDAWFPGQGSAKAALKAGIAKGTCFRMGNNTFKLVGFGKCTIGSNTRPAVKAVRWNKSRSAFNRSPVYMTHIDAAFVLANKIVKV